MFDFNEFYQGLLTRSDYSNNYWDQFPKGKLMRYKEKTLPLLKENIEKKHEKGLSSTLAILYYDGVDKDYTDILLALLDQKWHILIEDIVEVIGLTKDPKAINKLFEVAINVPDYDEMRALAKKCIYALVTINTPEAIEKLMILKESDDPIISENAAFQLEHLTNQH